MDVRRLDLLRELAHRGTIAAVAQAMHRTPSAVSQQLKVLEREAGVALTEPHGRGLRLTVAGRALADAAEDIAISIARAEGVWRDFMGQPAGEVTLLTFPTGGEMLLPGVLQTMRAHPHVQLTCTALDAELPDLAPTIPDYDIVIADSPMSAPAPLPNNLEVITLMTEPLDIAVPHGHHLAAKTELRPTDVIDETWIGVPHDYPFDQILKEIQNITGKSAHVVQRLAVNDVVEALVAAGLGIAILPRFTTKSEGLVTRPLVDIRSQREIALLIRPDRLERPSVKLVVAALQEEAQRVLARHS